MGTERETRASSSLAASRFSHSATTTTTTKPATTITPTIRLLARWRQRAAQQSHRPAAASRQPPSRQPPSSATNRARADSSMGAPANREQTNGREPAYNQLSFSLSLSFSPSAVAVQFGRRSNDEAHQVSECRAPSFAERRLLGAPLEPADHCQLVRRRLSAVGCRRSRLLCLSSLFFCFFVLLLLCSLAVRSFARATNPSRVVAPPIESAATTRPVIAEHAEPAQLPQEGGAKWEEEEKERQN